MGVQLVIYNSFLNFMLFMVLTRPIGSQRPMLYGLSKAQKKEISLRPILSMIKSPQSNLSTFLISVLEPVLDKFSNHTVPDSFSFVDQLYNSNLLPPPFPRSVCNDMLCMATKNVQFIFNDFIFRQIDGVAMGSPLEPYPC